MTEKQRVFRNGRWEDILVTQERPSVTPRKSAKIANNKIEKSLQEGGAISDAISQINQCSCDLTELNTSIVNLQQDVDTLKEQGEWVEYIDEASLTPAEGINALIQTAASTLKSNGVQVVYNVTVLIGTTGAVQSEPFKLNIPTELLPPQIEIIQPATVIMNGSTNPIITSSAATQIINTTGQQFMTASIVDPDTANTNGFNIVMSGTYLL